MPASSLSDPAIQTSKLLELVRTLRGPQGCPWDARQSATSMVPHLREESHELQEAINSGDPQHVCAELGDLLFVVIFISETYTEQGHFSLAEVCRNAHNKLVYRHPHVFQRQEDNKPDAEDLHQQWDSLKAQENPQRQSVFDGIPPSLPALAKAQKLRHKASKLGLDWQQLSAVVSKVQEEWDELQQTLPPQQEAKNVSAAANELGDLLFSLANLSRHLHIDAESALEEALRRFRSRASYIEGI